MIKEKFINALCKLIKKIHPNKYDLKNKTIKYKLKTIIKETIYLLKTGISYKNYRGPMNPKSLNYHILFFSCRHRRISC